jgi:DNA-binding CsgD family transcriptional regulator
MTSRHVAEDAVEEQLERRCELAVSNARRLLGSPPSEKADDEALLEVIAELTIRITETSAETGHHPPADGHTDQLERLRRRYEGRFDALRNVEVALVALRASTSPSVILSSAPSELCEHSQLDRVVLSLVSDGFIRAEAACFRNDPVGTARALEAMQSDPPRLEHTLVESDLLRRRRATIVADAQTHPRVHAPTAQLMGWHTYVAAPLVVAGDLIGAIHADTGIGGRPLDVLDGDVLWAFTQGVADAYETASLRRSLHRQRRQTHQFIEWLTARSIELSDTAIDLVSDRPSPPEPPGKPDILVRGVDADDRFVFEDLLTKRELDVLRLLSRGETNTTIAGHLVISEATVKFHVVNLLRKLHASNRAEAVSRYHRLVRLRSEDD